MTSYENLTAIDKGAFLAALGRDISIERKRLAIELRQLLNERRLARPKFTRVESPKQRLKT